MEELLDGFRPFQIAEYTKSADSEDHLGCFENEALLHQYTDGVKCRVFMTTLSGAAQRWFSQLPLNSIKSFNDFSTLFLKHFTSSKRYYKTVLSLFAIKQRMREIMLHEYIRCFNRVALEVSFTTPEMLINAFSQGLVEEDFFRSLVKKPPSSYDALLGRAEKYIHVEEAQQWRKDE